MLEKNRRGCRFIAADATGVEGPDGNFSGAIGLLQKGTGDLMLNENSQYLIRDFFMVGIWNAQPLNKRKNSIF